MAHILFYRIIDNIVPYNCPFSKNIHPLPVSYNSLLLFHVRINNESFKAATR